MTEIDNNDKDGARPNPYLKAFCYNKERADKEFAEIRGVPIEQTKAEYDALWKQVDELLHGEGLLRPNQPPVAIRATSI